jgi:hypothetical protein
MEVVPMLVDLLPIPEPEPSDELLAVIFPLAIARFTIVELLWPPDWDGEERRLKRETASAFTSPSSTINVRYTCLVDELCGSVLR